MKYFFILFLVCFTGCMGNNTTGTQSTLRLVTGEAKSHSESAESGTQPMVSSKKVYNIKASGNVRIGQQEQSEAELIIKQLKGELGILSRNLKYEKNKSDEREVTLSQTQKDFSTWKSYSTFTGILLGVGLLIMVYAVKLMRTEMAQWGISPKLIGGVIRGITQSVKDGKKRIDYLRNRLAENNISNEVKDHIRSQIDWHKQDVSDLERKLS